jgi:GNAT superfamily N-acetyltransferase
MVTVAEVTAENWDDLTTLFGASGAYSGCWCMWWRVAGKQFSEMGNAGNKNALHALAKAGKPLGLLAFDDGEPIGWASVAPRADFPRLLRSNTLKLAQEPGVWSVPCFFIHRRHRGEGVATALLAAAVEHAQSAGAAILEGYPTDLASGRTPSAAELYTGTTGLFAQAGFTVHSRPASGRRVVMRHSF